MKFPPIGSPFTVSEDCIITCKDVINKPTSCLGSTFFTHMLQHKDAIAQIDTRTGKKETFQQLLDKCIRTALHMSDKNIIQGDIIGMCSLNHLNSAVPYIASQFLGAKIVCVDPTLSIDEKAHLLRLVRPKLLFVSQEALPSVEKIIQDELTTSKIIVFGETTKHMNFSNFIEPHSRENEFQPVRIENLKETAVIHISSGVSGMPKAICINHYALVSQGSNYTHTENPDYDYMKKLAQTISFPITQLAYTSLYWISAAMMLVATTVTGSCRLVCDKFDPHEIWHYIEQYKPFLLLLIPVQVIELLKYPKPNVDTRAVQSIIIIGSPISKHHIQELQKYFPEVDINKGYGQTEVCGSIVNFKAADVIHRPHLKQKLESVGLPLRGFSYKVVDLETNANLGPNKKGELCLKTGFAMNGYFNQDSSEVYDEDGWLKTGDIAYYDEDFCFYVVDRIRESFKYQGWFVIPSMLEEKLLSHPAIRQAAVVGIPEDDGHHPMGLVVLKDNCMVSEEEINTFLEDKVPERFRLRAGIKIVVDLPMTSTGKVKRNAVKELALSLYEKKHNC